MEYGEGNYIFAFDLHRRFGGGTLPRGGAALSDPELQYIRAHWSEQYGAGQILEQGTAGT